MADGSYLSKARKNTLAAVRNLNDYNAGRNEAAIKANATSAGGWSGILLLFSLFGVAAFSSHGDHADPIDHQTAAENIVDDAGD
ncbi:MAG: hypothetical protein MZU91_04130 [Desulfosudis oleivorans]|nr:hypothetical protein [Desulfosudis oleivorans]